MGEMLKEGVFDGYCGSRRNVKDCVFFTINGACDRVKCLDWCNRHTEGVNNLLRCWQKSEQFMHLIVKRELECQH